MGLIGVRGDNIHFACKFNPILAFVCDAMTYILCGSIFKMPRA